MPHFIVIILVSKKGIFYIYPRIIGKATVTLEIVVHVDKVTIYLMKVSNLVLLNYRLANVRIVEVRAAVFIWLPLKVEYGSFLVKGLNLGSYILLLFL